jgi:hypothetical protein
MKGLLLTGAEIRLRQTSPTSLRISIVLAAVNDASRRQWRWPAAIIDRGCARCHVALRSGRRNGPSQTKKLTLDFLAAIRERMIASFAQPTSDGKLRSVRLVCSQPEA